jgi:hypothetical protein
MVRYKEIDASTNPDEDPIRKQELVVGDAKHIVDDLTYKIKRENDKPEPNQDSLKKMRTDLKVAQDDWAIKRKQLEILKLKKNLDREKDQQKQAKEREKGKGYE